MEKGSPIGVFDSGFGGLTVLKEIVHQLPQYDYLYLGDNARAPYGNRSFETVYHYTLQCVNWFFQQGCSLVILACNTSSAKALRTIQQNDLPKIAPHKRVLGVIRPTAEIIGNFSDTKSVGILATNGTVASESYPMEIAKFFPDLKVFQEACPMWVPLVENREFDNPGADYFIEKNIEQLLTQSNKIDTLLLACTHYPLLINSLRKFVPPTTAIIAQGDIVADSLADYLHRHPAIENNCLKSGQLQFYTTDNTTDFDEKGAFFYGEPIQSKYVAL